MYYNVISTYLFILYIVTFVTIVITLRYSDNLALIKLDKEKNYEEPLKNFNELHYNCSQNINITFSSKNQVYQITYIYEYSIQECTLMNVDANVCFMKRNQYYTKRCLPMFIIIGTMKAGTGALMR